MEGLSDIVIVSVKICFKGKDHFIIVFSFSGASLYTDATCLKVKSTGSISILIEVDCS